MKRELRLSGHKDYVAVDEVKDNKIVSTPFYLKVGEFKVIKYKDEEDGKWNNTEVSIKNDFSCLSLKDIDERSDWTGMEWESDFNELIDNSIIAFINL